jgi:predicted O-linked N-acetylglucosamine transferase (SPINDLY family)
MVNSNKILERMAKTGFSGIKLSVLVLSTLRARTTCCDFAQNGVPVLALEGKWWHARVASGLMVHLLGNDELVAQDLVPFEEKAVFYSQGEGHVRLQGLIRPAIKTAIQSHSGIWTGFVGFLHFKES